MNRMTSTQRGSWLRWLVLAAFLVPFMTGSCGTTTSHTGTWTTATAPWYGKNPCPPSGPCTKACEDISSHAAVCPYSGGCFVSDCSMGPNNEIRVTCECTHSSCLFESAE